MIDRRRERGAEREAKTGPSGLLPLRLGSVCDTGLVRDNNEDAMAAVVMPLEDVQPDRVRGVLVVADGMGGHAYGGMASRIAVEAVLEHLGAAGEAGPGDARLAAVTLGAVRHADRAIRAAAAGLRGATEQHGMGTTLTVVAIAGNTIAVGHVGDTRAYLIRNDTIDQLTDDHTWAEEEIRQGRLSREEALSHRMSHYLTRSLGTHDQAEIDVEAGRVLWNGDVLVLCSDGLTAHVEPEEIVACVHATRSPQAAAERMLDLAIERGGTDNLAIVVAEAGSLKRRAVLTRPLRGSARAWMVVGLLLLIVGVGGAGVWMSGAPPAAPRRDRPPAERQPAAAPTAPLPGTPVKPAAGGADEPRPVATEVKSPAEPGSRVAKPPPPKPRPSAPAAPVASTELPPRGAGAPSVEPSEPASETPKTLPGSGQRAEVPSPVEADEQKSLPGKRE